MARRIGFAGWTVFHWRWLATNGVASIAAMNRTLRPASLASCRASCRASGRASSRASCRASHRDVVASERPSRGSSQNLSSQRCRESLASLKYLDEASLLDRRESNIERTKKKQNNSRPRRFVEESPTAQDRDAANPRISRASRRESRSGKRSRESEKTKTKDHPRRIHCQTTKWTFQLKILERHNGRQKKKDEKKTKWRRPDSPD